ncbi:Fc receptor-like protein 5 [Salminus brasiliensis]|uniref:Fc receptor-like protein 5 n=1 Tax=Salminus brasiliensis TaxID=930266 RepID=UPI003B8314D7
MFYGLFTERPKAVVTIEPDSQVFRGETVSFRCFIQGVGDNEWTYSWNKIGQSNPYNISQDFSISSVTDSDSGDYTCRGTVRGTSRTSENSAAVTLTVSDLPRATLTVEPDSIVFTGESVTLKCEIEIDNYWSYQWDKGSRHLTAVTHRSISFTISSAAAQGQYWCRGLSDYRPKSSQDSNAVTLTVRERPTPELTITPNPAFRGEIVTLRCHLKGEGVRKWTYSWYRIEYMVSPSSSSQEYVISSVTDSDSGDYTCRGTVTGTSRYSHTSAPVTLTVSALPRPTLTVEPKWSPLFTRESVTLKCEISNYDGWRYQWEKQNNQRRWSAVSQFVYHTVNNNTLTIRGDAVVNGDQYRCKGERHDRPRSSQYSISVALTPTGNPKATVSIKPDNQVLRGETVTLRCDLQRGGVAKWTYSWNKSDHTVHISNTSQEFIINSVVESDSGKYTCRGERRSDSQRSEISDAVTLTVSAEAQAVLSVSPQSWLTEGDSVTLSCEVRGSSTGWTFSWYRDNDEFLSDSSRGSGGPYTLSPAALHHTGVYMCRAERGDPVYHTQYSNPQPLWITATSPPASLTISPSRSQHFTNDPLSLSCEGQSNSTGWRVRRYTHSERVSDCVSGWGSVTGSTCNISSLYSSHTGVYWCESESGGSSSPVNITVHNGAVILESPVHPLTSGDPLILSCLYHHTKSFDFTADFYKDGLFLQTQTTGEMTIRTVSKSDEGLYHCKLTEGGESPQSWISVRGVSTSGAPFSVLSLLSSLMAASPYLMVSIILGVKCFRAQAKPEEMSRTQAVTEVES